MSDITVYALRFDGGVIYIGLTKDVARRLEEHKRRKSPSTKRFKGNFELIYQKSFETYLEARSHEKYLKSGYGRRSLAQVNVEGSPRATR